MQEYATFLCLQQEDMHSSALYVSMEYHVLVHALRSPCAMTPPQVSRYRWLSCDMQYVLCSSPCSGEQPALHALWWILGTLYSYMVSGVHMVGTYSRVSNTSWWSLLCSMNAVQPASMSYCVHLLLTMTIRVYPHLGSMILGYGVLHGPTASTLHCMAQHYHSVGSIARSHCG